MIDEIDTYKIGEAISREELEQLVGCTLSIKVCNDILGAHGFIRNRSSFDEWRRVSESSIEPYRRNEPIEPGALKKAFDGIPCVSWSDIIKTLGMHPSRASVNKAMADDGWTWVSKKHVWRKNHGKV